MVKNIRTVETSCNTRNGDSESELNFTRAQRSVIVKGDVKKGDIITQDNITTKRPLLEDSIPAIDYYNTIGKVFTKDLKDDMILRLDNIGENNE